MEPHVTAPADPARWRNWWERADTRRAVEEVYLPDGKLAVDAGLLERYLWWEGLDADMVAVAPCRPLDVHVA